MGGWIDGWIDRWVEGGVDTPSLTPLSDSAVIPENSVK